MKTHAQKLKKVPYISARNINLKLHGKDDIKSMTVLSKSKIQSQAPSLKSDQDFHQMS